MHLLSVALPLRSSVHILRAVTTGNLHQ